MNRLAIVVPILIAMPALLAAQEAKLVNCRSLEAAGNFVGPDEVLDGDRVCKKSKPSDLSTAAKPESAKPAVPAATEPVSVAEAARANAIAKAVAKKSDSAKDAPLEKPAPKAETSVAAVQAPAKPAPPVAPVAPPVPTAPRVQAVAPPAQSTAPPQPAVVAAPSPAPVTPASTPVPAASAPPPAKPAPVQPAAPTSQPVTTSAPSNPTPAAAPVAAASPAAPPVEEQPSAPTFGSAVAPRAVSAASPVQKSTVAAVSESAPPVRIHRDAPVAPGTPSEAPEIDHGFSDANAVEAPASETTGAANTKRAAAVSTHAVQAGAFDSPRATNAASQTAVQPVAATDCAKNITLGNLQNGSLTVGAPAWAEKWIAKNQNRLNSVCFSATPQRGARNFLIVFYTAPSNGQGASSAMPLPDSASGTGDFTTKGGSAWHYASGPDAAPAAESSVAITQIWYATAYTELGAPVAERWPDSSKHGDEERASEDLLNSLVDDVNKL
jgi:hypothetical protein